MGWESIKTRIDFLGLSLFHKIHLGGTRPLIKTYITEYYVKPNSRQGGAYRLYKNYGVKFLNSFFPYITKKWNDLPRSIRSLDLADFKARLKTELKPVKIKYFAYGGKIPNKLHTRLRVGRTFLNSDSFLMNPNPQRVFAMRRMRLLHII